MRAITFSEHGGPEVLRLADAPQPRLESASERAAIVRVRACALNHLDLWVRRGIPGVKIPLPHIPGSDIAGEIAEIGARSAQRFGAGDRVIVAPGLSCGECPRCLAGDDNLCRQYVLYGYQVDGGCAEYVKAPVANLFPAPANLSWEEAAAMPLVFLTAWHMLMNRARLRPGETALVLGASSGVGSAAIQIAKVAGARVISTAGSEQKLARARELGADEAVLHSRDGSALPFSEDVRRLTAGRGVDVVFEHAGKTTWDQSLRSLATGGRLVTCGATTGFDASLDIRFLFTRSLSVLGSFMGRKADLAAIFDLAARGSLKPVVDSVLPLAQAADAHRRLESRAAFGKVVLLSDSRQGACD